MFEKKDNNSNKTIQFDLAYTSSTTPIDICLVPGWPLDALKNSLTTCTDFLGMEVMYGKYVFGKILPANILVPSGYRVAVDTLCILVYNKHFHNLIVYARK
jgi:hypothetical protein